jgi:hypothetical protein
MNLRNTIPVCLAALLGFLLGAMFTHQTTVKAQSTGVKISYKQVYSFGGTLTPGTQVVGFSCVPHGTSVDPDCYVAYMQ